VHAPTDDTSDDMKDSLYEELEHLFDQFLKYHMKILLEHFNAKLGREDTIRDEDLHEIRYNNGVRVVNFASMSRVQCSHITIFINTLGLLLIFHT